MHPPIPQASSACQTLRYHSRESELAAAQTRMADVVDCRHVPEDPRAMRVGAIVERTIQNIVLTDCSRFLFL
jgi:hypothetical protein